MEKATKKSPSPTEEFFDDVDHARLKSGWGIGSLVFILVLIYLLGLWLLVSWLA